MRLGGGENSLFSQGEISVGALNSTAYEDVFSTSGPSGRMGRSGGGRKASGQELSPLDCQVKS